MIGVVPGLYAMVGAAAALSGVTVSITLLFVGLSLTPHLANNCFTGGYHV